jgi:hypothetical protein
MRHALLKLKESEAECGHCAKSMAACKKRYDSLFHSQMCTEQFKHLVVDYLGMMKYGTAEKFSPSPIERPKDFQRK